MKKFLISVETDLSPVEILELLNNQPNTKAAIARVEEIELLSAALFDAETYPILKEKVDDAFEFSFRTLNCLRNAGIFYVADLVQKTPAQLLNLPNFGKVCLKEVKDGLARHELMLGMVLRP
jgi:DNA-directed RNA polymerase alpha subunit